MTIHTDGKRTVSNARPRELSRAERIERDRLANAAAIHDALEPSDLPRGPACGQCGNPYPGTLVEGICACCQRDNQLSLDPSKLEPYEEAHGLNSGSVE